MFAFSTFVFIQLTRIEAVGRLLFAEQLSGCLQSFLPPSTHEIHYSHELHYHEVTKLGFRLSSLKWIHPLSLFMFLLPLTHMLWAARRRISFVDSPSNSTWFTLFSALTSARTLVFPMIFLNKSSFLECGGDTWLLEVLPEPCHERLQRPLTALRSCSRYSIILKALSMASD